MVAEFFACSDLFDESVPLRGEESDRSSGAVVVVIVVVAIVREIACCGEAAGDGFELGAHVACDRGFKLCQGGFVRWSECTVLR